MIDSTVDAVASVAPICFLSDRPTSVHPVAREALWTPIRAYIEELTGDTSGRIPQHDSVSNFEIDLIEDVTEYAVLDEPADVPARDVSTLPAPASCAVIKQPPAVLLQKAREIAVRRGLVRADWAG